MACYSGGGDTHTHTRAHAPPSPPPHTRTHTHPHARTHIHTHTRTHARTRTTSPLPLRPNTHTQIFLFVFSLKDFVCFSDGPGNSITFNPDKTSHPVEENSDLTVTCAADCKPECDFVWKRGSTDVARGAVLFLEALQRNQAGTYTCTADNAVNQPTTKQITVDVLCK